MLGPKLREWPSLRRLLEVGVTISGTGRRETGLERSEYDQGQHDDVRTVLAVNTAGMLVRRSVLEELGGFDEQLAVFGNDIDFGWRAAAAGHKTVVVPAAVVFHVEAAHRGVRRTPLTGRHTHYQERRAAMYTLLANARAWALPWKVVRLLFGTLLRVLGFLLVRSVGQAFDELAALVSLYGSPGQIRAARRERKSRRPAHEHDVRGLLAPWWLPYRHGLDVVSDLATALTLQAQDVAERRRAAAAAAEGDHPVTPRRRDDRRRGRRPGGRHRAGGPVPDQPGRPRAGGVRAARAVRSTRGHRSRQRRRALGRARPTPAPCGDCRPSRGTPWPRAPPCPRRRTCCRSRCWRPCSAAASPRRCRRSCCSPSRSRSGARGGS